MSADRILKASTIAKVATAAGVPVERVHAVFTWGSRRYVELVTVEDHHYTLNLIEGTCRRIESPSHWNTCPNSIRRVS